MTGLTVDFKVNAFATIEEYKDSKKLKIIPAIENSGPFRSIALGEFENSGNTVTSKMIDTGMKNIDKSIAESEDGVKSLQSHIENLKAMKRILAEEDRKIKKERMENGQSEGN
ncbi:hypothetical protein [Agarilytica rhodophyticola]|uniref:hypothetical protein n=1 Tax=Agarilytica rhodophyticola TaxID=1737490 RepID=UPI000B346992|nr:hypothetical protein [Agarilytica rhodophyticola]